MTEGHEKTPLTILLAAPRGFCAGVDRAIQIVDAALDKFGPPVYVRHEIVHNRFVVESLEAKGAVFVDELDEIPTDKPVVFSAHGVPKSVPAAAEAREMVFVDATCPLVSKVHVEAERHFNNGLHILLIGHEGHPEVIGTMGQLPDGSMSLIETVADAEAYTPSSDQQLAFVTQTTLSVDDTADIVTVLKQRFPNIVEPRKDDICYATTNRQQAVKAIADESDIMLVIGAPNSSNSMRLVEVGERHGADDSMLVQRGNEIEWDRLLPALNAITDRVPVVGITAGASAPEVLVEEVIDAFRDRFDVTVREEAIGKENVQFKLPRILTAEA
ncbi:MAG: 4-hydroxy-3-methylbut-2-enyl diphosphate reductase [Alphaproteobacteria bacterium]